jgi:hypothetical protein
MQITEKQKTLINLLFQELLKKGKKIQLKEVLDGVTQTKEAMNGLMDMDGAIFQYARDNDVEKQFQDAVMDAEINLKEESELIEQKPIKKEKETEVKPMENVAVTNQKEEKEIQTFDLSKIPTTKEELEEKKAQNASEEKLIIEGDAVITKVALEVGTEDHFTKNNVVYRDYLLALTFNGCDGEGEVTERYAGITGWLNNGILSDPSFDSSRNTKVAKIFKQFAKAQKINTDEIETGLHLGLLIKFLQSKPKVLLVDGSGSFTNAKGQEIKYKKNDIAKFY